MITCKDASLLIEHQMHEALPLGHRIQLRIHLLICPPCRKFGHQTQSIRKHLRDQDPEHYQAMSGEARQRLLKRLLEIGTQGSAD